MTEKPPYRIPSMDELRAVPENGLTVLSTFTGAGGSCLGFRWAGYRTVAACEFVEAARDTYRANFPGVPVYEGDVRDLKGQDFLDLAGVDSVDVFEGSPPCASFSTAGKRSSGWGKVKSYSDTEQRSDDLFDEYVRLIREIQPRVFVAENVSGLVKGVAKGYFREVVASMRDAGYRVGARVLDAQWLGVPQRRQRVIFVGVRDDVDRDPIFPEPLPYRYSIRDALPWLNGASLAAGRERLLGLDETEPTVQTHGRLRTRSELAVVGGPAATPPHPDVDGDGPSIDGYAIAAEYDRLGPDGVSKKYLSLIRADAEGPSPTITAMGGQSPGVAGPIHPSERRKFTIAELRRLCGFPDDFVLTGTYAQQWERCGRAVPPPMMRAVAASLAEVLCAG